MGKTETFLRKIWNRLTNWVVQNSHLILGSEQPLQSGNTSSNCGSSATFLRKTAFSIYKSNETVEI